MPRPRWIVPASLLILMWLGATAVTLAIHLPPAVAKALPYLAAGLLTGAVVPTPARREAIIAVAWLALASAVGWTAFTATSTSLAFARVAELFAVTLPLHALAAAWAYLGLFLAGRARARRKPAADEDPPELQVFEDELRRRYGLPKPPDA